MSATNPTNKNEARARIAQLRQQVDRLNSSVPEKAPDGTIRYFAPNSTTVIAIFKNMAAAKTQINKYEKEIAALNTKFFAEEPAAPARASIIPPNSQSPGAAGPRVQRPTASQLAVTPKTNEQATKVVSAIRQEVDYLRSIKPGTSRGGTTQYTVDGEVYTEAGYNKLIRDYELRANEIEIKWQNVPTGEQRNADILYQRYTQERIDVRADLKVITDAARIATKVDEKERLQSWAAYIEQYISQLDQAIGLLGTGVVPPTLPSGYRSVSVTQAKKETAPTAQQPSAPFTPGAGQGVFGQPITETPVGVMAPTVTPSAGAAPRTPTSPVVTDRVPTTPATPSRVPLVTLEQINAARKQQGLSPVELVDGKYREVVSKKEVPASEVAASTGTTTTGTTTVAGGGTGGAAVGGTTTGAVPPAGAAPGAPAVPPAWEQAAREQFGAYYEVVKNIPEVMKIIERDMTVGLSDAQFQAELEKTTWWRTTTASARAWEEDKARDPATVQTRVDNQLAALRDTSLRLGLRLRDDVLAKLAEDSLKFGWSNTVIQNAIGSEALKSTGGVSDLRRGYIGQTLRATAGSYGVPLSDVTFNEWVGKIATGQENEASFQAYALDLAKNLYPSLAASLDKGISFRAITDPYRQAASRILEVNPETIDFADPKWAQAFTARDDKGQQMMMTYGEWNDYLRTNPTFGYEYTDGAKERAFTVANRLAELFGAA